MIFAGSPFGAPLADAKSDFIIQATGAAVGCAASALWGKKNAYKSCLIESIRPAAAVARSKGVDTRAAADAVVSAINAIKRMDGDTEKALRATITGDFGGGEAGKDTGGKRDGKKDDGAGGVPGLTSFVPRWVWWTGGAALTGAVGYGVWRATRRRRAA